MYIDPQCPDPTHSDRSEISYILLLFPLYSHYLRGHTTLYEKEHPRNMKIHFDSRDTLLQSTEVALYYEYKPLMPQAVNQMEQDRTQFHLTYTNSANPVEQSEGFWFLRQYPYFVTIGLLLQYHIHLLPNQRPLAIFLYHQSTQRILCHSLYRLLRRGLSEQPISNSIAEIPMPPIYMLFISFRIIYCYGHPELSMMMSTIPVLKKYHQLPEALP